MKVVINACYGGFGLSDEAVLALAERKGVTLYLETKGRETIYWTVPESARPRLLDRPPTAYTIRDWVSLKRDNTFSVGARNDPDLVAVVENLGERANGPFSKLKVIEIPDDVEWQIEEYDGFEHIAEAHRTWGDCK